MTTKLNVNDLFCLFRPCLDSSPFTVAHRCKQWHPQPLLIIWRWKTYHSLVQNGTSWSTFEFKRHRDLYRVRIYATCTPDLSSYRWLPRRRTSHSIDQINMNLLTILWYSSLNFAIVRSALLPIRVEQRIRSDMVKSLTDSTLSSRRSLPPDVHLPIPILNSSSTIDGSGSRTSQVGGANASVSDLKGGSDTLAVTGAYAIPIMRMYDNTSFCGSPGATRKHVYSMSFVDIMHSRTLTHSFSAPPLCAVLKSFDLLRPEQSTPRLSLVLMAALTGSTAVFRATLAGAHPLYAWQTSRL